LVSVFGLIHGLIQKVKSPTDSEVKRSKFQCYAVCCRRGCACRCDCL